MDMFVLRDTVHPLLLLLVVSILRGSGWVSAIELVGMAVYNPGPCSDSLSYNNTIELARARHASSSSAVTFSITSESSCSETAEVVSIVNKIGNYTYNKIMIGPAVPGLCDTISGMLSANDIPVACWSCASATLSKRNRYQTLMRSVTDGRTTGQNFGKLLTHFQWKRVAIVVSYASPYLELSSEIYVELSKEDFIIRQIAEVDPGESFESVQTKLSTIDSDTKAVILCLRPEDVDIVLLAAQAAGLTSGNQALFLSMTHVSLTGTLQAGELRVPVPASLPTTDGNYTALQEAYKALMIVHAHPNSLLNNPNSTDTQYYSDYDENLYNAMVLAMRSTVLAVEGGHGTDGISVATQAQNLTFDGLTGPVSTDDIGQIISRFSLWDYDMSNNGSFRIVAETWHESDTVQLGASIDWPAGRAVPPDTCEFKVCEGFSLAYIIAVVVAAAVVVAGAVGVAVFIRNKLAIKEMDKGPNKLVLQSGDLTFVSPKSLGKSKGSVKASSMFEKPDLLKASEPSLSNNSFSEQFGDITETARYNGDLVYVKELAIKGFEMKGKTRTFLKTMRDLRHENINSFIGLYIGPLRPALAWEYCTRKSLEDIIHNEDMKLDWDFKLSLLTDLVRGIRYMHNSVLKCHGNLKSGNLVIDSRFVLKITDYGEKPLYEKYQTKRDFKARELLWTAPEMLRDENLLLHRGTPKADIYSFAIIMQEVILRGHPFCMLELNAEEVIRKVRKPPPLCRPSVSQGAAPPQYIQIMKQCWSEMPDMRPDIEQIYQQFKEINRGRKMNIVDTMFRMLEKYSTDLEEIVKERTVALEDEKRKTEHLLTQMLPSTVAASLLSGKPVEAETYEEVTIYFSDIVGFTTISAMSNPMQVVDLLNDLYTMFDSTIDDYDVYKVETIGDAYMVSSGLPDRNGNRHAGEVGTMALDLLCGCSKFKIRHMPEVPLRLRIGLHTGPAVAGVVGLRMPRYCLFGDTVNTASRMESTGTAFRVHISQTTKEILDLLGGYHCEFRGETELKGKGIHKTYWLTGKDGFTKKIPEPPEATGSDNHGLGAYVKDLEQMQERLTQAEVNDPPKASTSSADQCNSSPPKSPTISAKESPSPSKADNRDSAKVSQGSNNNNNSDDSPGKGEDRGAHRDSSQSTATTGSKKSEASTSPIHIEEKPSP